MRQVCAGTIGAVGEAVADWAVGDRVLASVGLGGYASQAIASTAQLTRIPDGMSAPAAAAFTQSYCTALFALTRRTRLEAGEKLPPIIVFHKGKDYFLADGWHRLEGAKKFGVKDIEADVRKGSRRD